MRAVMLHSLPSLLTALIISNTEPDAATIAIAAAKNSSHSTPATSGEKTGRRIDHTIAYARPYKATPGIEARSRFWSGAFGGFLRKIKIPANTNQQSITITKTAVGKNSSVIFIRFLILSPVQFESPSPDPRW